MNSLLVIKSLDDLTEAIDGYRFCWPWQWRRKATAKEQLTAKYREVSKIYKNYSLDEVTKETMRVELLEAESLLGLSVSQCIPWCIS